MAVVAAHPSVEELSAFAHGTLATGGLTAVETHLSSCSSCQQLAVSLAGDSLVELLRRAHLRNSRVTETVADGRQAVTPAPQHVGSGTLALSSMEGSPVELDNHERYRLVRLLGAGGMGSVYMAEHRVMQRPVALKVINRAYTTNAASVERFRREVRAAARLSHPNIVTAFDAENAGETHFLVMEFVEGTSLGRLLKERGPLPVVEACDYIREAALGLQHAHERGMVHRDVKPDNLIVTPDGTVKVLDFGLAALTAERGGGLTDENVVMGTPEYMAPEQAEDARKADIRADVYSLGCTLYQLLAGGVPFPAETALQRILAHRDKPTPSIRQVRPETPQGLAEVLRRMLAKKPQDRFATPGEVAAALAPFTVPQPVKPTRSHRSLVVAVAAMLLLLVAGATVYRIQTDKGELIIQTESDDVEVVVKQGGKIVRIVDTKTNKSITLTSGEYVLELKGQPEGLKLNIDRASLTRGETVLARIERVGKSTAEVLPKTEGLLHQIKWGEGERFAHVDVSFDGRYFLAGRTHVGTVRVWDTESGKHLHEFAGYVGRFLPDDQVVTGSWDGGSLFRIYDLRNGKLRGMFHGPNPLWNFSVSPDGSRLLSLSPNRIHVWDVARRQELFNRAWNTAQSPVLEFSRDSKLLLYQTLRKPPLRALDASTGKESPVPAALQEMAQLQGLQLSGRSADGRWLLYGSEPDTLLVFDAVSGQQTAKLNMRGDSSALSGDGRRLLSGRYRSHAFRVWDVVSGKPGATLRVPKELDTTTYLAWVLSGDGRIAVIAGHPDWLHVYRLPDPPQPQDKQ